MKRKKTNRFYLSTAFFGLLVGIPLFAFACNTSNSNSVKKTNPPKQTSQAQKPKPASKPTQNKPATSSTTDKPKPTPNENKTNSSSQTQNTKKQNKEDSDYQLLTNTAQMLNSVIADIQAHKNTTYTAASVMDSINKSAIFQGYTDSDFAYDNYTNIISGGATQDDHLSVPYNNEYSVFQHKNRLFNIDDVSVNNLITALKNSPSSISSALPPSISQSLTSFGGTQGLLGILKTSPEIANLFLNPLKNSLEKINSYLIVFYNNINAFLLVPYLITQKNSSNMTFIHKYAQLLNNLNNFINNQDSSAILKSLSIVIGQNVNTIIGYLKPFAKMLSNATALTKN